MPKKSERSLNQKIWAQSPRFAEARQRGLNAIAERWRTKPRCGAKTRVTGEPCQQLVEAPGKRCRYHGGATPKGDEWHRRQPPKRGAAYSRLEKKLKAWEVRDRKADERRAAMTPDERAEHEKRRKSKQPSSSAERQMEDKRKESARWLQGVLAKKDKRSYDKDA